MAADSQPVRLVLDQDDDHRRAHDADPPTDGANLSAALGRDVAVPCALCGLWRSTLRAPGTASDRDDM
jgi:hypothetical protein